LSHGTVKGKKASTVRKPEKRDSRETKTSRFVGRGRTK